MRLFLAIRLSESAVGHVRKIRDVLPKWKRDLNGLVSWTRPENWHVTLKFLGEVEEPQADELVKWVSDVPYEPFDLFASGMLYFPPRGPVRVISVGVDGVTGQLNLLQSHIESACEKAGFAREQRAYVGHITIGRAKQGYRASLRRVEFGEFFPGPIFGVSVFELVKSQITPSGSSYTHLRSFPAHQR